MSGPLKAAAECLDAGCACEAWFGFASNINWTTVAYVVMHCTFDMTLARLSY